MLSVFRIVVALLYLQHPMAKFFAFPHLAAFDNLQPFAYPEARVEIDEKGVILHPSRPPIARLTPALLAG